MSKLKTIFRWTEQVIGVIVFVVVLIFCLPALYCIIQGAPLGKEFVTQVLIKKNQMIVQGYIDKELAVHVHSTLATPHDKIDIVLVSSVGGEEGAARDIASELNNLGPHTVVVPSKYVCESACILLGLGRNTQFAPADDATLMFHRAWLREGPDSCAACRLVAWEANRFKDAVFGKFSHRQMFIWAEQLAPGLGLALSKCKPNPFDMISGITITGSQFSAFQQGNRGAIVCPNE